MLQIPWICTQRTVTHKFQLASTPINVCEISSFHSLCRASSQNILPQKLKSIDDKSSEHAAWWPGNYATLTFCKGVQYCIPTFGPLCINVSVDGVPGIFRKHLKCYKNCLKTVKNELIARCEHEIRNDLFKTLHKAMCLTLDIRGTDETFAPQEDKTTETCGLMSIKFDPGYGSGSE